MASLDETIFQSSQDLLDYVDTLTAGEELMFTLDMPAVPVAETAIVLAQASSASAANQQPDFILRQCKETQPTPEFPRSALRVVDPAGMLQVYAASVGRNFALGDIKVSLLSSTKHGKLTAEVDNTGMLAYRYDPTPGFFGNDGAIFMAEHDGRRYKIILDIKVLEHLDEKTPVCPPPKLIIVNKPRSDLPLDGVSVTFSDLPNSSLGQTTGPTITLDTNAANHGWYIDYTPYLNEEYLPTSNPNEWIAKEGTGIMIGDRPQFLKNSALAGRRHFQAITKSP